jgi:hypothetical protein
MNSREELGVWITLGARQHCMFCAVVGLGGRHGALTERMLQLMHLEDI